jgi:hypothetical protein
MDLRPYIDLLEDTDLRRGHGSEAVHRSASVPCPLIKSVSTNLSICTFVQPQIHVLSANLCLLTNLCTASDPCPLLKSVSSNK